MNALTASGLTLSAGGRELLHNASLEIAKGGIVAVIGVAGCGKSSLVRALCGVHPSEGNIFLDGMDARKSGWDSVREKIGVLLSAPGLVDDWDAFTNVAWRLIRQGMPFTDIQKRVNQVLGELGLSDALKKHPNQLSGGMQRRVALARALIHHPALLLLDDPTAGLDPITTTAVMELLLGASRRHGAAVLLTTHDLDRVASHADRVLVMKNRSLQVASGGPQHWGGELAA